MNVRAGRPAVDRLAFDSNRDSEQEIYVMGNDGSEQTRLTNDPNSDYDYGPAWSANGNKIAFTRHVGANFNYDIYVMNPDGSAQKRVTSGPGWEADPAWVTTVVK